MTPYLLSLLRTSGADAWELTETRTEGWEFYFIRHALDQHRVRNVTHTSVRVYKKSEDGAFLGSASSEIHESATEEETRELLSRLLFQASLVRNPVYTLNEPRPVEPLQLDLPDISSMARDFMEAMQQIPETAGESINSYEIFVHLRTRHFMNSNGIDLTETSPDSMIEVVVNARAEEHEIELYRAYTSGTCSKDDLIRDLTDTLRFGRDRLHTVPTPPISTAPVILSTSAAVDVYRYFAERMGAAMKYRRLSDWEIGQKVCDANLTLEAVRTLPNSSGNHAFDPEGAPVRDLLLIENGTARAFWGSEQYAGYLGLKDAFIAENFRVSGGTSSASELRTGNYLEVVEFSDFQVNSMTGDIAGEIRLGYWHEGDRTTIVSGGSVSGNMRETPLSFSKETRQYDTCLIPSVTRLETMHITGIDPD